jgi:hypothetical protein
MATIVDFNRIKYHFSSLNFKIVNVENFVHQIDISCEEKTNMILRVLSILKRILKK